MKDEDVHARILGGGAGQAQVLAALPLVRFLPVGGGWHADVHHLVTRGLVRAARSAICFCDTMRWVSVRTFLKASPTLMASQAEVSMKDRLFFSAEAQRCHTPAVPPAPPAPAGSQTCLAGLAVHLDAAGGKLHTSGALALQVEFVAGEAGQQVALPHNPRP